MNGRGTNGSPSPRRLKSFRMPTETTNKGPTPKSSPSLPPPQSRPTLGRLRSFKFPGPTGRTWSGPPRMPGPLQRLSSFRSSGTRNDNDNHPGRDTEPPGPRRIQSLTGSFRMRMRIRSNAGNNNHRDGGGDDHHPRRGDDHHRVSFMDNNNNNNNNNCNGFDDSHGSLGAPPPQSLVRRRPVIKIDDDRRSENNNNNNNNNEDADSPAPPPTPGRNPLGRSNSRRRFLQLKQALLGSSNRRNKNGANGRRNENEQIPLVVEDGCGNTATANTGNTTNDRESDNNFTTTNLKDDVVMLVLCREFHLMDTNESSE